MLLLEIANVLQTPAMKVKSFMAGWRASAGNGVFEEAEGQWRNKARAELNTLIRRFGANSREKSSISPWNPDIIIFRRRITINPSDSPLIFPVTRRYEGLVAAIARWLKTYADAEYVVQVYDDEYAFPGLHHAVTKGCTPEEARAVVKNGVTLISSKDAMKSSDPLVFAISFAIVRREP